MNYNFAIKRIVNQFIVEITNKNDGVTYVIPSLYDIAILLCYLVMYFYAKLHCSIVYFFNVLSSSIHYKNYTKKI